VGDEGVASGFEGQNDLGRVKSIHIAQDITGFFDMLVDRSRLDAKLGADPFGFKAARDMRHALALAVGQRLDGCPILLQFGMRIVSSHGATRPSKCVGDRS
jgi:hypothetical protein